jgi:hypothetical protein
MLGVNPADDDGPTAVPVPPDVLPPNGIGKPADCAPKGTAAGAPKVDVLPEAVDAPKGIAPAPSGCEGAETVLKLGNVPPNEGVLFDPNANGPADDGFTEAELEPVINEGTVIPER